MLRIHILVQEALQDRLAREAEMRGMTVSELGRYMLSLNMDAQLEEVDRVRASFAFGPWLRGETMDRQLAEIHAAGGPDNVDNTLARWLRGLRGGEAVSPPDALQQEGGQS